MSWGSQRLFPRGCDTVSGEIRPAKSEVIGGGSPPLEAGVTCGSTIGSDPVSGSSNLSPPAKRLHVFITCDIVKAQHSTPV